MQRTSLNKVLCDLETDGVISLGYRSVSILERDRLTKLAALPH